MSKKRTQVPSYRLHDASGQARVTLSGKDFYLGVHGTPESRAKYVRLIQEWEENGRREPPKHPEVESSRLRVNDLIDRYLDYVEPLHAVDDVAKQHALLRIKLALRPLMETCGKMPAKDFGPLALERVRAHLIDQGLSRGVADRERPRPRARKLSGCATP